MLLSVFYGLRPASTAFASAAAFASRTRSVWPVVRRVATRREQSHGAIQGLSVDPHPDGDPWRIRLRCLFHACPVTRFGPLPAPHRDSPILRHIAALLSGLLSQIKFGPLLQNARLGAWEPGLSLRLRPWVTRPIREFNKGDFTMYQNRISLIGFLGNDATPVATNNANFTALSLATKSSYKDKTTGKYIDHTEWHRCIAWGGLAEYAKTLKKGAHLAIEGELRSRERTDKRTNQKERVWEVRVTSILKLDRAEKASPEESVDQKFEPEEEAA